VCRISKASPWRETSLPCASRQIARALGGSPVHIALDKKTLYHAAATLASGQVLALVEAATQLLISLGMKCNEAARARHGLGLWQEEVIRL